MIEIEKNASASIKRNQKLFISRHLKNAQINFCESFFLTVKIITQRIKSGNINLAVITTYQLRKNLNIYMYM